MRKESHHEDENVQDRIQETVFMDMDHVHARNTIKGMKEFTVLDQA